MKYLLSAILFFVLCGCGYGRSAREFSALPPPAPGSSTATAPASSNTGGSTGSSSSPSCVSCSTALATASTGPAYYISPTGNDSNSGTSSSPWRTFAHAIPRLTAGSSLLLENGIYTSSNSGYPYIYCSYNAQNGTATSPITIAAQNPRQAFLKGDGTTEPFHMIRCSYWNVIGLHAEDGDFINEPGGVGQNGNAFDVYAGSHLYFASNIGAKSNRYKNAHVFSFQGVTYSLIEKNECYYNYRHCFLLYGNSNYNEVRYNYANSRGYWKNGPSGDYCGNCGDTAGFMNYGSSHNIWENNISENEVEGHNNEPISYGPGVSYNSWYGEMSVGDTICFRSSAHQATSASNPSYISWTDGVCVNPFSVGLWSRSSYATTAKNLSFWLSRTINSSAVVADRDSNAGMPPFSLNGTALHAANAGGYAVYQSVATSTYNYLNSYNNAYFSYGNPVVENRSGNNPSNGGCYVYIQSTSPLHGTGPAGTDIGANALYAYSGGVKTSTKLWNTSGSTAKFLGAGAIVTGLNDKAGSSLFDVATRLNVGTNGCVLPSGY